MHRFYLPPERCGGDALVLEDREALHAIRVLRICRSDRVTLLDGQGGRRLCRVESVGKNDLRLVVLEHSTERKPAFQLNLYQAVVKAKGMDTIIQKATELGAAGVVPLLSERVEVRLSEPAAEARADKWRQVAIEALKQCGGAWLPEIAVPHSFDSCLANSTLPELSLVASLQHTADLPGYRLREFERQMGRPPASVGIWIGPEGDFTAREYEDLLRHGVQPVSLGPRILRSETAAIYGLAVLSHELQMRQPDCRPETPQPPT